MEDREKLLSFLAYFFGWVSGLIIFLMEKKSQFIKFNAMQSIIFSGIWIGCNIILTIINLIPIIGKFIGIPISAIVNLGAFVIWIVLLVKSFQGEKFKLPLIGDYAEKYSKI